MANNETEIIEAYKAFIGNKVFPCIAARSANAAKHILCMVADNMACPKDDHAILYFLYQFIDNYRKATSNFYSAAIIFRNPQDCSEDEFDGLLWQRLQAISDLDAENYDYDPRVNSDPASVHFSFSLKQEAFFILGLHPAAKRLSRKFRYPTLAFNPHQEFEKLRANNHYEPMKEIVRKRDLAYSGSINPMLKDFGEASEAAQYSGRYYSTEWRCPFIRTQKSEDRDQELGHKNE